MRKFDIQTTNFLRILRRGAFDEGKPIGIMSPYKWAKTVNLAEHHSLTPLFALGVEKYYKDDSINIPGEQINVIREHLKNTPQKGFGDLYDFGKIHLKSKTLDEKLSQIVSKEYADAEKSYETMMLMSIIIVNVEHMMNGYSYLRGIIDMGRLLRQEGNKVDFVKLDNWLSQTRMSRIANLQGSLLINSFGFTKEEIPYVSKVEKDAMQEMMKAVYGISSTHSDGWHFQESKSGFIVSSPLKAMRSIRQSLHFRRYAPRESYSTIYRGFLKGLSEIEE